MRRSTVYRAELLFAVAQAQAQAQAQAAQQRPHSALEVTPHALTDVLASLLGFTVLSPAPPWAGVLLPGDDGRGAAQGGPGGGVSLGRTVAALGQRAPTAMLQASMVEVVRCMGLPAGPAHSGSGLMPSRLAPLTLAECAGVPGHGSPAHQPLIRPQRLWPALRRTATQRTPGRLDVPALLRQVARGQPLKHLPRQSHERWTAPLWVVWDLADHLQPYWDDYEQQLNRLRQLRGDEGLMRWAVYGSPRQVLWADTPLADVEKPPAQLPVPPAGSRVLLCTDLGALAPTLAPQRHWLAYARAVAATGSTLAAWSPITARQLAADVSRVVAVHGLQSSAPLRPLRGALVGSAAHQRERTRLLALRDVLLTASSCAVKVQPPLLRAMRSALPACAAEPALEALAWSAQPLVAADPLSRPLQAAAVVPFRQGLSRFPVAQQHRILQTLWAQHAGGARSSINQELLLWQTHASPYAVASVHEVLGPEWAERLAASQTWFDRFAIGLMAGDAPQDVQTRQFASGVLARQRADASFWRSHSQRLAPIWAIGQSTELPAGLDPLAAHQALAQLHHTETARRCTLVQRGSTLWLWPFDQPLPRYAARVGGVFETVAVMVVPPALPARSFAARQSPVQLADLLQGPVGDLLVDGARLSLDAVSRPAWAQEFGRDRHGLYADLRVGTVVQRMRWIPPGEGAVGSTVEERERLVPKKDLKQFADIFDRESPRHRIRITQGYWLADTACTQALWLAVMGGKNPSRFADDATKPVENVSHQTVERFIAQLGRLAPSAQAALPTEAQWEYACRAGTETAFHWGDEPSHEHMNFDQHNKGTVSVKCYAPNAWGLYQMHGNVWEWCDDHGRSYGDAPEGVLVPDPQGQRDAGSGAPRAVRGGSWFYHAGYCRSALRYALGRGGADGILGFRFALRSTSTGQAQPRAPEGTVVRAAEQTVSPLRDEAGSAATRAFKRRK